MVALTREMLGEIPHLMADTRLQAAGEFGIDAAELGSAGKPNPAVDPVLDAAADHVSDVEIDRHLVDPRRDEPLERAQVALVTRLPERPREIERVVELAPLQP